MAKDSPVSSAPTSPGPQVAATPSSPAPPFVCLVASGGHTHIVAVEGYDAFRLIGRTRDDAAGEALDKVARALGLPYPGGPALEALAREGDPHAVRFHSALHDDDGFDFSFSGLKTAAVNRLHTAAQRGEMTDFLEKSAARLPGELPPLKRLAARYLFVSF